MGFVPTYATRDQPVAEAAGPGVKTAVLAHDLGYVVKRFARVLRQSGIELFQAFEAPDAIFAVCRRLAPCVLIVGPSLFQKLTGAELSVLSNLGSDIRVLLIVPRGNTVTLRDAVRLNFMGVLSEGVDVSQLRRAIIAVARGEYWANRASLSAVIQELLFVTRARHLTMRELEIVRLVGLGLDNRTIADKLSICRETVRWHLRGIYSKLSVNSREDIRFCAHWIIPHEPGTILHADVKAAGAAD
jgi:DNA-binding NarL/FixJ family response regulator